MYRVLLADGTAYDAHWCGASGGALSISLYDGTLPALAEAFGDPERTLRIEFVTDAATTVYEGYTYLTAVIDGRWQDSDLVVQLRREG